MASSLPRIFIWTQFFNGWQNLKCVTAKTVELDSAQQSTAFENKDAARFVTLADDVVAQDVYPGRRQRLSLYLEIDARAAAWTFP